MSDEQRFMSVRAYSRLRNVADGTIRHHIRAGTIRLVAGKVDRRQADQAWAVRRRGRYQSRSDPGAQAASGKLRRLRARLEMQRDQVAKLRDEYAPRTEVVAQYEREAAFVLARLSAMPMEQAEHVAEQLAIPPEKARALLDDFVRLCLADLGDLRRQLVEVVARV
jgi:hypothetical protein